MSEPTPPPAIAQIRVDRRRHSLVIRWFVDGGLAYQRFTAMTAALSATAWVAGLVLGFKIFAPVLRRALQGDALSSAELWMLAIGLFWLIGWILGGLKLLFDLFREARRAQGPLLRLHSEYLVYRPGHPGAPRPQGPQPPGWLARFRLGWKIHRAQLRDLEIARDDAHRPVVRIRYDQSQLDLGAEFDTRHRDWLYATLKEWLWRSTGAYPAVPEQASPTE